MGKKRKASGRVAEAKAPGELDPAAARLGPISTFEDVANSEDEYFLNRDKLMLDDDDDRRGSKRRKQDDEVLELSDEEVFGYQDSDSDSDSGSDQDAGNSAKVSGNDADQDDAEQDENESGWWGSSKQAYYDADNIETEADALEEEAEAKRLQQKKLSKMKDEDFVFDGDEWLAGEDDAEDDAEAVTEVLTEVEVTDDMAEHDMAKLLTTRYPEFGYLADELRDLHPVLAELKAQAKNKPGPTLEAVKYWVLGCYVAALAGYLAILTSPARDGAKLRKTLAASELRDHDVMDTLVSCRKAWERVKHLEHVAQEGTLPPADTDVAIDEADAARKQAERLEKKTQKKKAKAAEAKQARKLAKAKAIEDGVADLYDLPLGSGKPGTRQTMSVRDIDDDNSDFGEEDALDARAAADKAARKKSLKFYTSQIVQKASRRAGAGRDAGGDVDIPYRERLRDRQARLVAAAEKRGLKGAKDGADLGDDSDEEDGRAANAMRDDEDDYYDMVAHSAKSKRDDKAARYAAYAAASKADRVVETEEIGEDGKRKVTYAIEKNKGLAPKRSKDVRNPRVKKRKQYDAKQKKLRSMKPVWKGGEPKGGYRGELSGINTAVIKSTKL